jgi:hypothetical protein
VPELKKKKFFLKHPYIMAFKNQSDDITGG